MNFTGDGGGAYSTMEWNYSGQKKMKALEVDSAVLDVAHLEREESQIF